MQVLGLFLILLLTGPKTASLVPNLSIQDVRLVDNDKAGFTQFFNMQVQVKNDTDKPIGKIELKACHDAEHCQLLLLRGKFGPKSITWSDDLSVSTPREELTIMRVL